MREWRAQSRIRNIAGRRHPLIFSKYGLSGMIIDDISKNHWTNAMLIGPNKMYSFCWIQMWWWKFFPLQSTPVYNGNTLSLQKLEIGNIFAKITVAILETTNKY